MSFINKLASDCSKSGNLYGVLITGLYSSSSSSSSSTSTSTTSTSSYDCIDLFQHYINRTGDVQTAAVAIIHSKCEKTSQSKHVTAWIEHYRDLLDSWMLWEQRF